MNKHQAGCKEINKSTKNELFDTLGVEKIIDTPAQYNASNIHITIFVKLYF